MALFSKPPIKKPGPRRSARDGPHAVPGRSPSAREVANHAKQGCRWAGQQVDPAPDITVTGGEPHRMVVPGQPSFEVAQANPGLCAVLEDAALRFASGHADQARALLEQGVQTDHDTKISPLAWLALFDLLQRAGDKPAFDQFALQYVVQFERSAPAWEATEKPQAGRRASPGGYIGLTGQAHGRGRDTARRSQARDGEADLPQARLDLSSVTGFDDEGARLLATRSATRAARSFRCSSSAPRS